MPEPSFQAQTNTVIDEIYQFFIKKGIFIQSHRKLYALIPELLDTPGYAFINNVPQIFEILENAGIVFQGNENLYYQAIQMMEHADKLPSGFEALQCAGLFFEEHKKAYLLVIMSMEEAEQVPHLFQALGRMGLSYHDQPDFYQKAIASGYVPKLIEGLETLFEAGIRYQDNPDPYTILLKKTKYANQLAQAFRTIIPLGMVLPKEKKLYEKLLSHAENAGKLPEVYKYLLQLKLPFFYDAVIWEMEFILERAKLLELYVRSGIHFPQFPEYFEPIVQLDNAGLAYFVFNSLIEAGYDFHAYKLFFDALLEMLSDEEVSFQEMTQIVHKAIAALKADPMITNFDLERIIEEAGSPYSFITAGPLNKSRGTKKIEALLAVIADKGKNCHFFFEKSKGYVLSLPFEGLSSQDGKIYLSLLLKNANLSQLQLEEALIDQLGQQLNGMRFAPHPEDDGASSPLVKLLPYVQQLVIELYICAYYKNINRLFRAEEQLIDFNVHINGRPKSDNMRAYFIIGCLLADTVNKLPSLLDALPEKTMLNNLEHYYEINMDEWLREKEQFAVLLTKALQDGQLHPQQEGLESLLNNIEKLRHLYPHKPKRLDRGEVINEATIKSRCANVWRLPSLTSVSATKGGEARFHGPETVRTFLENPPYYYILNPSQKEIILAPGLQLATSLQENKEDMSLVSTVLSGLEYEPQFRYWSDNALSDAFERHLSKDYIIKESELLLAGTRIVRPNHGLAHTYRGMLAIDVVVQYFSHHAKDLKFKLFCRSLIDSEDLEWLRVASAFRVTGRESETSAIMDLALYTSFRQASSQNFRAYVQETAPNASETMVERMAEIVLYMGNPHYESQINVHEEQEELEIRNYYHRILSIAHQLDLPRCRRAEQFKKDLLPLEALSEVSSGQQQALRELVWYMIGLIKAHGNQLLCDMLPDGSFIDINSDYKAPFEEVSHSLLRLFELSDSLPRLKKTLAFQFEAHLSPQQGPASASACLEEENKMESTQEEDLALQAVPFLQATERPALPMDGRILKSVADYIEDEIRRLNKKSACFCWFNRSNRKKIFALEDAWRYTKAQFSAAQEKAGLSDNKALLKSILDFKKPEGPCLSDLLPKIFEDLGQQLAEDHTLRASSVL